MMRRTCLSSRVIEGDRETVGCTLECVEQREPVDEVWRYVPLPPDADPMIVVGELTVDGESFVLRRRVVDDGSTHYDWVSGPNDGYGFSVFGGFEPVPQERHVTAIRGFLAGIDPLTGYLAE